MSTTDLWRDVPHHNSPGPAVHVATGLEARPLAFLNQAHLFGTTTTLQNGHSRWNMRTFGEQSSSTEGTVAALVDGSASVLPLLCETPRVTRAYPEPILRQTEVKPVPPTVPLRRTSPGINNRYRSPDDGYSSAGSCDSDLPLEVVYRCRKLEKPLSPASEAPQNVQAHPVSNGDSQWPDTKTLTATGAKPNAVKAPLCPSFTEASVKMFLETRRNQNDIDWVDQCERCIEEGLRCYTAAGSDFRQKSCYDCFVHHKVCMVDGQRVYKKKSKRGFSVKNKHKTSLPTRAENEEKRVLRRSGRRTTFAQLTPVILTQDLQKQNHNRERRRELTPTGPALRPRHQENGVEQDRSYTDSDSSISDLGDEYQRTPKPNEEAHRTEDPVPGKDRCYPMQIGVAEKECEVGNRSIWDRTVVCPPQDAATLELQTQTEAVSRRVDNMQLGRYTNGLLRDIGNAIRRCQERIANMSDQAGLVVLQTTTEILLSDLNKLIAPENRMDNDSGLKWILPQLCDYLQSIRLQCQIASAVASEEKTDQEEKRAKQVAAVLTSELLCNRCLTLISLQVGEDFTKPTCA